MLLQAKYSYEESKSVETTAYENKELYVKFRQTPQVIYCYHDVPKKVFREIVTAKRPGVVLHDEVIGTFEMSKLYLPNMF